MTNRPLIYSSMLRPPEDDGEAYLPEGSDKILEWNVSTRFHDWSEKDHAQLRSWIEQLGQLGVIGEIAWYTNWNDDRVPAGPKVTWDWLLGRKAERNRLWFFEVGSFSPRPWRLSCMMGKWDEESSQMSCISTFSLWFMSDPFEGHAGSERLVNTFRRMHTAHNTEFAALHPHIRMAELTFPNERYDESLTFVPMFQGVCWANYLSTQHLKFFDEAKLSPLSTYRFEYVPQTSLFMQVSPDVAQATSPEVEAEMFRLTDAFRAALR